MKKQDRAKNRIRKRLTQTMAMFLAGMIALVALSSGASALDNEQKEPGGGHSDQITRLYRTVLGRDADPAGHGFWADRLANGEPIANIAQLMLDSAENEQNSSGDPVIDAYRWALDREPDADGYAYWSSLDPIEAVIAISDSEEHRRLTGTSAPPPVAETSLPPGWVDAGHGVAVPQILLDIRFCESRDNYTAANPRSTARGAYQFLRTSWAAYGHAERYGVSEAHLATPAQQDEAALLTWEQDGTRPWRASQHCWG